MHGERRDQIRGRELRAGDVQAVLASGLIIPSYFNSSVYGLVGDISTIDPDDAAAAGSNVRLARSDHQHAATAGTPDGLTRTATSAENNGSSWARNNHTHATDQMAWGRMAHQILTTNSSVFSGADATSDFSLADVVVDSARLYVAYLLTQYNTAGAAAWVVNFHVDATLTDRFYFINVGASTRSAIWAGLLWTPTSGTKDLDVRVDFQSGSDLQFEAASTNSRQFWVADIGPRS